MPPSNTLILESFWLERKKQKVAIKKGFPYLYVIYTLFKNLITVNIYLRCDKLHNPYLNAPNGTVWIGTFSFKVSCSKRMTELKVWRLLIYLSRAAWLLGFFRLVATGAFVITVTASWTVARFLTLFIGFATTTFALTLVAFVLEID